MQKTSWKKRSLAVCMVLLLGATNALAEDQSTQGAFRLGEIEVVEKSGDTPNVSVQRVQEETMRAFNTDTVDKAVNLLPGVTMSKVGARNERMIYIRGLDQKHVPIYMDGIPIYVPYDGYPDLGRFTTFDLANITVSKGFSSVLYGPNTMGGAVNLVSKRPTKAFEATTGFGAGSNSWNGYTNMGTNQGLWYLQTSVSRLHLDTYPLSSDFEAKATEGGATRDNAKNEDTKGSVKVGFTPNDKDEYALTYVNQHGVKNTPPYAGDDPTYAPRYWKWPYWDKESVYFNSETWIGSEHYVKTRLYYDEFENSLKSYTDSKYVKLQNGYPSNYSDNTVGASIELGTFALPMQDLKLALHYKRDYHSEQSPSIPDKEMEEEIFSIGLEDTIHFTDDFYAIAGLGYDRVETRKADDQDKTGKISSFPTHNTDAFNPQLGLFYKVTPEGIAHASVAMKSRMPSLKDKFSYRMGRALPNPDLDPERSVNYEVGYKHSFSEQLIVEGNVFYNDISDFILNKTVPDPSNPKKTLVQNQNIGDVDIYGVELGVTAKPWKPLTIGLNYTWLDYDNQTNDDKLLNTPEHKFFSYVRYQPLDCLSFLADVEHDTKRFSSSDGKRVADGYTLVGLKATYEFLDKKYIEAGLDNLFDENYAIDEGYPEAGRTWFVNVRMEF